MLLRPKYIPVMNACVYLIKEGTFLWSAFFFEYVKKCCIINYMIYYSNRGVILYVSLTTVTMQGEKRREKRVRLIIYDLILVMLS